jgi:NTP pyrophosphatase (non-canonical NTP hydrolase)
MAAAVTASYNGEKMASILSEYQKWIGDWNCATFPESTLIGHTAHIELESNELSEAVTAYHNNPTPDNKKSVQMEAADILIMLLSLSHRLGFDLLSASSEKFRILKDRQWLPADESGVYHHIAEDIVA